MRLLRVLAKMLTVLGLLLAFVTILPVDYFWVHQMAKPWGDARGDILIVLGGDSLGDMIGYDTYWRSVYAVRVWREGGWQRIVVSGGRTDQGAVISEQIRDFLLTQGVPADRITTETASTSTRENAVFTQRLLAKEPGKKVLLTSDFHIFRAYKAFEKAGLSVEPRPIPDALKRTDKWTLRWPLFLDLMTETAKLGYYFCRGWI